MASRKKTITSDDILGKEAVDPEGQILGIVMKLHIDKASKMITGVTIDQGFMKPDLFVGIGHVRNFGVDSVFLSRVPVEKFKGLEVITSTGKPVGTVKGVREKRHKVEEITVARTGMHIRGKMIIIPASEIKEIGENFVLKKGFRAREVF